MSTRAVRTSRADIDAPGAQRGYSPLHVCAEAGVAESVRLLLEAGVEVSAASVQYGVSCDAMGADNQCR